MLDIFRFVYLIVLFISSADSFNTTYFFIMHIQDKEGALSPGYGQSSYLVAGPPDWSPSWSPPLFSCLPRSSCVWTYLWPAPDEDHSHTNRLMDAHVLLFLVSEMFIFLYLLLRIQTSQWNLLFVFKNWNSKACVSSLSHHIDHHLSEGVSLFLAEVLEDVTVLLL